jgi:hypothetical protein
MGRIFKVTNHSDQPVTIHPPGGEPPKYLPGKTTVQWQEPKVIISDGFLQDFIDATAKWNFNRRLRRAGLKTSYKSSRA